MDFFENAHRPREETPKKVKKARKTVKKHLKRMLNAYKDGNKEELKNIAESSLRYDTDDVVSISDYSEFSYLKDTNITQETISSDNTLEALDTSAEQSSKSNESVSEKGYEDTLESITEYKDNLKTLSSSKDLTVDKDKSLSLDSSSYFENSSNESEISIPSSLRSSDVSDIISDDEPFDPDGALASEIIKKLKSKERELTSQIIIPQYTKLDHQNQTNKKHQKIHEKKEESMSDDESLSEIDDEKENQNILADIDQEIIQDSSEHSLDDLVSNQSSPYVSVTAFDTAYQSLTDVIGDYKHSTIKNLPSDRQNTVETAEIFEPEFLAEDIAEEVDSLIPELDDELRIDDLNLESDTQELTEETAYDDTVLSDNITDDELSNTETEHVKIKVYPGNDCFILIMKHPAELHIHGKVKVSALGGSAELFGYTLQEKPVHVYAPYCYYTHCVKTVECNNIFRGLFGKLTQSGVSVSDAEDIVTSIREYDAVICLSKLGRKQIDFVDNNFYSQDLFSKRSDSSPSYLKRVAENLGCSLYVEPQKRYFEEKENWEEAVNCGKTDQSRGIICGGKGTGKSTFLRYYINRILDATGKPVLVIDLDPGQAEMTLPGNISVNIVDKPLIGQNFTHLRQPERMLNLGMINTMDNPMRYISAVGELIAYCRSNHTYRAMPWIVNTMGMCNNMGLKFITYIILQIKPTFLYQIDSKTPKKRFEYHLHSHSIKKLYHEFCKDPMFRKLNDPNDLDYAFIMERFKEITTQDKISPSGSTLTPKDERYLNILAYFGTLLDMHRTQGILEIVPYEVSLSSFNVALNVKIPQETLTKVINGKIVALCQLTAEDKGKVFTLADKALLCHGHGLIRGIDSVNGLLYVLTPAPMEKLKLVNTLVYSDWMPELLNQERSLPSGTIVPYRTTTVHQHRQLMFPPRRRFNPLQLLKMSRNT